MIWKRSLMVFILLALPVVAGCSDREPEAAAPVRRTEKEPEQQQPEPKAEKPPEEGDRAKPDHEVGQSVIHGPADYMQTVTITAPRHIKKQANLAYISREIKQFQALKARPPKSLEELEQWRGEELQEPPGGYEWDYDPESGELDIVRKQQKPAR